MYICVYIYIYIYKYIICIMIYVYISLRLTPFVQMDSLRKCNETLFHRNHLIKALPDEELYIFMCIFIYLFIYKNI